MKFKSYVGKRVLAGGKEVVFVDDIYETDDEKEIEALKNALEVSEVKGKASKETAPK